MFPNSALNNRRSNRDPIAPISQRGFKNVYFQFYCAVFFEYKIVVLLISLLIRLLYYFSLIMSVFVAGLAVANTKRIKKS